MRRLIFFAYILLTPSSTLADDPGMPDTVIVDTVYADLGQPYVDVPIYAVTDEHVAFYNMPITWSGISEDIVPVDVSYFNIIRGWDEIYDSILVENNLIRMYGWTEYLGAFLNTDSLRLHCWSIQFAVDSSAAPQIVTIDTTHDFPNGSLVFFLEGGIECLIPIFIPGAIYYGITTDADDDHQILPGEFVLLRNYPNPFNGATTIKFTLPKAAFVELSVYDLLGREVAVLEKGLKPAGKYKIPFNSTGLSSGVYFYSLRVGDATETKRMVLLK